MAAFSILHPPVQWLCLSRVILHELDWERCWLIESTPIHSSPLTMVVSASIHQSRMRLWLEVTKENYTRWDKGAGLPEHILENSTGRTFILLRVQSKSQSYWNTEMKHEHPSPVVLVARSVSFSLHYITLKVACDVTSCAEVSEPWVHWPTFAGMGSGDLIWHIIETNPDKRAERPRPFLPLGIWAQSSNTNKQTLKETWRHCPQCFITYTCSLHMYKTTHSLALSIIREDVLKAML